jgi:hypothetical protein
MVFFLGSGRLLEEVHIGLIIVVFEEIGSFVEADMAGSASVVHVPFSRNILGQFRVFVGHRIRSSRNR